MVSQGHSSTRFSWRGDRLCHDNRLTGIELIPDSKYPGMWRIKYKDTISDMVACHDYPLAAAAVVLGYASPYRGRTRAGELLAEAGNRLDEFWRQIDRRRQN